MTKVPGFYTRAEAAAYLGLSVARMNQIGQDAGPIVPDRRLGKAVLYTKASLDAYRARERAKDHLLYEGKRVYTVAQAAKLLGLSRESIHINIRSGRLPVLRQAFAIGIGYRYLVPEDGLRSLAEHLGRKWAAE